MLPKKHIIAGAIFSFFIFIFFPIKWFEALIIFFSSVLIDFDHYLYYVYKKKDMSLKRAYLWFINNLQIQRSLTKKEKSRYKRIIFIFHGIEFWTALFLLFIFINKIFLFILIGIIFHIFLDLIEFYIFKERFIYKISQLYTLMTNKNKLDLY